MSEISKLRKLQLEEIDAVKSLIEFCNDNGLTYYLRGGSVLGAVKYNGMIPWDDDIDVILPREDYNNLVKIIPEKIGNACFAHYSRDERLNCYFARLYLDQERVEETGLPTNNAYGLVLIDILPVDGIPQNRVSCKILKLHVNVLRLLASVHTLDHKDTVVKRSGIKKIFPEILNKLKIHKLYKQIDIYKRLEKVYSRCSYETAYIVGILAGSKSDKEVFPKSWLGNGFFHEFENLQVRIPEKHDEYLKLLFGEDYLEREPKETERIQKHFEGGI